jgi:predicted transcriptional regulator
MQTNPIGTYLISVRPTWADAFFSYRNPKTIELRKGNFGASLKPGDSIVIYATMPVAEIIGTVKVVKRESLAVDRLWQASKQGRLAKVSREQFETYYTNQESGIGVWVGAAELWQSPIALCRLRQNWGHRWQPPQQIQQLADEQISALYCFQRHKLATTECYA